MIDLKQVNKYYFKGRAKEIHVINDVTLELPDRGLVAIFGKSGCGKTTLLNAIGGLDRFTGSIKIDGQSIQKNTDELRNRCIGYIFQNYNLNSSVSVYENVAEALRLCGMTQEEEIQSRVLIALGNVGMEKFIHRMPDTLSGGQKQRVAIARAIVKSPAIILADEPTGNLDEANTILVMDLLKNISKEHLVVLVTHEDELVDIYCDQVVEVVDGKIADIRTNTETGQFSGREKNVVYLGELEQKEVNKDNVTLRYYGNTKQDRLELTLIEHEGRYLLKVNSPKVSLLTADSEIVVKEGVFEEKKQETRVHTAADYQELPPVAGKHYGKLFTWKKAIKESYSGMRTGRGGLVLRAFLILSVLVVMAMATLYSISLGNVAKVKDSSNPNTFYLSLPSNEEIMTVYDAMDKNAYGIDYVRVARMMADEKFVLNTDIFSSFSYYRQYYLYDELQPGEELFAPLVAHGISMTHSYAKEYPLLCGKKTDLARDEVVISRKMADTFIENTMLGYIDSYYDLLGMKFDLRNYHIAGVVDCPEAVIFVDDREIFSELSLKYSVDNMRHEDAFIRIEENDTLQDNEVIYQVEKSKEPKYAVSDVIEIHGQKLTVKEVRILEGMSIEQYLEETYGLRGEIREIKQNYSNMKWEITLWDTKTQQLQSVSIDDVVYRQYRTGFAEVLFVNSLIGRRLFDYQERYLDSAVLLIHSKQPEVTEAFLTECFGHLKETYPEEYRYWEPMYRPADLYERELKKAEGPLRRNRIIMEVLILFLCLSVYMTMRGNVLERVKEIGIYRCLGVKRKNLLFRFWVETMVLTTLTVLPVYLLYVGIVKYIDTSTVLDMTVYFPATVYLPLLIGMYAVCLIFGVLPAMLLLRKTPSEIMAKYDI